MSYKEMLHFAKKYSCIYCFGAGEYGHIVHSFLMSNDIVFNGFVVSNKSNQLGEDGIQIYSIQEFVKIVDRDNWGMILSLSEKYHDEVEQLLCNNHVDIKGRIYKTNDIDLFILKTKIFKMKSENLLVEILSKNKVPMVCDTSYDEHFKAIIKRYDVIKIKFIEMNQIGGIAYWIYNCNMIDKYANEKKVFHLFFPFKHELYGGRFSENNFFQFANNYLIDKLQLDGIEVVSRKSFNFWNYCVRNYPAYFDFVGDYSQIEEADNYNSICEKGILNSRKQYIVFNEEEEKKGEGFLEEHKINQYVCLFNRDSVYRREIMGFQGDDLDKIDYYRNSDIKSFDLFANYFKTEKIASLRMGAVVERKVDKSSVIIDYSNLHRTEFLDVFLFARCLFFIGDPSGISVLPCLFNKPIIQINTPVLTTRVDSNLPVRANRDLMILQKLWSSKLNRFLTIREMLQYEIYGDGNQYDICAPANTLLTYQRLGIRPIKNTPEEILSVGLEMYERLRGKVVYSQEDVDLQEQFNEIKKEYMGKGNYFFDFRIGRDFLRENKWLLE